MERRRWPALVFVLLLAAGICPWAWGDEATKPTSKPLDAAQAAAAAKASAEEYELYQVFADTLDQVERNYVKKVDRRELMEAAIHGVLSKLDPYSNYISPDDLSRFKTSVESQFGGIGIQITIDHDQLKILSPIVGSPAYRAGLQSGDYIVEIEGKSTDGLTLDEAVRKLKGEAGSSVTMSVIHPGGAKKEIVSVKREVIRIDTVLGDLRKDSDAWDFMLDKARQIGYVRITAFSRETAHDLKKALDELKSQGLKGLIIDLRFNPGGLLTSAIDVSDLFVAKGRIVSTKGRNTPERTWDAQSEGTYEGFPVAVLVNRYSASASEIFSACLQDHQRAVIIGERTWGKGSVQNVIELENGKSALKLTTASYQRPSGKNIHRFPDSKESDEWGVMPDKGFELRLADGEMGDLMRYRRDRDILRSRQKTDMVAAASAAEKTAPAIGDEAKPGSSAPAKEAAPDKPKNQDGSKELKPEKDAPSQPATDREPGEPSGTNAGTKPNEASKPDAPSEKSPAAKPDENKPGETKSDAAAGEKPSAKSQDFVDRQLQKALDYLTQELARAQ
jgi:carboxyl-terminal processing protease